MNSDMTTLYSVFCVSIWLETLSLWNECKRLISVQIFEFVMTVKDCGASVLWLCVNW